VRIGDLTSVQERLNRYLQARAAAKTDEDGLHVAELLRGYLIACHACGELVDDALEMLELTKEQAVLISRIIVAELDEAISSRAAAAAAVPPKVQAFVLSYRNWLAGWLAAQPPFKAH
jgi:hypothetical protein